MEQPISEEGNITLFLQIEKYSTLGKYQDKFSYNYVSDEGILAANITFYTKNITAPSTVIKDKYGRSTYADYYIFLLARIVPKNHIDEIKLDLMPAFKLSWYYKPFIQSEQRFNDDEATQQFFR